MIIRDCHQKVCNNIGTKGFIAHFTIWPINDQLKLIAGELMNLEVIFCIFDVRCSNQKVQSNIGTAEFRSRFGFLPINYFDKYIFYYVHITFE